jgi:mRNA interferase HigB
MAGISTMLSFGLLVGTRAIVGWHWAVVRGLRLQTALDKEFSIREPRNIVYLSPMRLITKRNLNKAIAPYSDAVSVVVSWSAVLKKNSWKSLNDIRESYSPSVDEVYGYTVFNIKGNKYRLVVRINYQAQIIYFKKFMTHAEYSEVNWANEKEVRSKIE